MPSLSPTERVRILQEEVLTLKAQIQTEHKLFPVLENKIAQLEEQKKLGDTRLYQFILIFIGGLITLGINLVVSFIRK